MTEEPPKDKYSAGTAFLLWMTCLFGVCGIHRFYLGRPWSGLLYFLTFGFFGIGQVIDLIRLRGIVDDENLRHHALEALAEKRALAAGGHAMRALPPKGEPLRVDLARAAQRHGGKLSVAQGVVETGRDFKVVEAELDAMAREGYVEFDTDDGGTLVYVFGGLLPEAGEA